MAAGLERPSPPLLRRTAQGYPAIAPRFMSRYRERGKHGLIAAFVARARRDTTLYVGLATALVLAVAWLWTPFSTEARWALSAAALSIPASASISVNGGACGRHACDPGGGECNAGACRWRAWRDHRRRGCHAVLADRLGGRAKALERPQDRRALSSDRVQIASLRSFV
jgi:hypothetical protein